MTIIDMMQSVAGGILIGLSATLLLLFTGRIAGISGIFTGLVTEKGKERLWRLFFLAGLLLGGSSHYIFQSYRLPDFDWHTLPIVVIAGLLVGFGTRLGGGCTSGHGVCGIGRLSPRSIIATCIFMGSALSTVLISRYVF